MHLAEQRWSYWFKHSVSQQILNAPIKGVLTKNATGFQLSILKIPSVLADSHIIQILVISPFIHLPNIY